AKRNDAAVAAARAALDLLEQAKSVGPIAELEQKVGANPLDHQARFDLAVALNSKGERQAAIDHLLEIVKRDRKWNDDGARYQAMIDDAMRSGHRLIGMIQPDTAHPGSEQKPNLFKIGCVGRITQIAETGDGRYLIQLTGIARFRIEEELSVATPYRQCRVA